MGMRARGKPRRDRRRGFSLAEVVVALGVAATGLAGALSASTVAASVSRDVVATTRAIQVARVCLARRGELVSGESREWYADAAEIRATPFPGAVYRVEARSGGAVSGGLCVPVCLTISWPPNGQAGFRLMTSVAARDAGVLP